MEKLFYQEGLIVDGIKHVNNQFTIDFNQHNNIFKSNIYGLVGKTNCGKTRLLKNIPIAYQSNIVSNNENEVVIESTSCNAYDIFNTCYVSYEKIYFKNVQIDQYLFKAKKNNQIGILNFLLKSLNSLKELQYYLNGCCSELEKDFLSKIICYLEEEDAKKRIKFKWDEIEFKCQFLDLITLLFDFVLLNEKHSKTKPILFLVEKPERILSNIEFQQFFLSFLDEFCNLTNAKAILETESPYIIQNIVSNQLLKITRYGRSSVVDLVDNYFGSTIFEIYDILYDSTSSFNFLNKRIFDYVTNRFNELKNEVEKDKIREVICDELKKAKLNSHGLLFACSIINHL